MRLSNAKLIGKQRHLPKLSSDGSGGSPAVNAL